MSRAYLEELSGPVMVHGRLPRTAETHVLIKTVGTLAEQLPKASEKSAPTYGRMIRDALAVAVASLPPANLVGKLALRHRALNYIAGMPPGQLSPARMQAELGLTRATLYRLFQADGGVLTYDRTRRLRLLHHAVADPVNRSSLANLAARHGFVDRASLARLFRSAFGYSMRQLREQQELCLPSPKVGEMPFLWRQGIMDMLNSTEDTGP
jgi:AraC-like DNA-binding protein